MSKSHVSKSQLASLERKLDKLFSKYEIDVEFSGHFHSRLNDARNKKQITVDELADLFNDTFKKYGKRIAGMADDDEAVLVDMSSSINIPFVINIEKDGMEMVSKTIMRKKGFKTRTRRLVMDINERLEALELKVEDANANAADALSEAKNPMADEVVKLIHDKRAAIKAKDRKLEAKLNKQIAHMTFKMAAPPVSKLSRELQSWLKSKEKELKKELAGLPVRLIVNGGNIHSRGSHNSPNAARASFGIEFILDPVL